MLSTCCWVAVRQRLLSVDSVSSSRKYIGLFYHNFYIFSKSVLKQDTAKAVFLPKIRIVYGQYVRRRKSEFWVDYIRLISLKTRLWVSKIKPFQLFCLKKTSNGWEGGYPLSRPPRDSLRFIHYLGPPPLF